MPDSGIKSPSTLYINEVSSSNGALLRDEDGDTPDFIELYNAGEDAVDLDGYSLSDDPKDPKRWTFGRSRIESREHLLVFASGKDVRALDRIAPEPRNELTKFVWHWADSQNDPKGESVVLPDRFPTNVVGEIDGKPAISAALFLADNAKTLGWSAAVLHHGFSGGSSSSFADYSAYNRAYIEATIDAGVAFELRLCVADSDCSDGYLVNLIGTGEERHRYEVPLESEESSLDLSRLNGFELRPVALGRTSKILITDFGFYHGGYFLHTNFEIDSKGETLRLSNPSGEVLDSFKVIALNRDVSYGISAIEPGHKRVFSIPSPGSANGGPEYLGICAPPVWDVKSGAFPAAISAQAARSGSCEVHYTLDGSPPSRSSPKLESPLRIESTRVVKSTAAGEQWLESEVETQTYFIGDEHVLPIVSISTTPSLLFDEVSGIYVKGPFASTEYPYKGANFWQDREIPATIQFFESDGSRAFEGNVGLSIFGNYSRGQPMKSFAVQFRGKYGQTHLDYPLFPSRPELQSFDSFVLRNSGGDFGKTMIRDAMESSLTDGMNLEYQAYRPAVVYINGEYFGLYNLMEKVNADYFDTHFGWAASEFDLLRPGEANAQVGTAKDWTEFTDWLRLNGAASAENYAYVRDRVDVDDFIDYNCAELYFGNSDWPGNNVKWYKAHAEGSKYRWVLYDSDAGYNKSDFDALVQATTLNDAWPNPEWSTLLLRSLLANESFKARFLSRCAVRLATNFSTERALGRIDAMSSEIAEEIPRFLVRWELSESSHLAAIERLKSFARARPQFIFESFARFFGLPGTAVLTVDPGGGTVLVDGIAITGEPIRMDVFVDSPITLEAVAPPGSSFIGYNDGNTEKLRTLNVDGDVDLVLHFE
ncbi:MAG: CotH kinase family protein [Polyangiaceae bacterium]